MVRVRVRAHSQAGWGIDYLKDDSCKGNDPMTFDQPENAWRMYDRKSPPPQKKITKSHALLIGTREPPIYAIAFSMRTRAFKYMTSYAVLFFSPSRF